MIRSAPVLPAYAESLEIFRPLYEVVRKHWRERSFEINRNPVTPYVPVGILDQAIPVSSAVFDDRLNLDDKQIALWPKGDRAQLWQVAAQHL